MFTKIYTNDKPRKVTRDTLDDALIGQDAFKNATGSLRGLRDVDPTREDTGRLSNEWRTIFRSVLGPHQFVVWSYATPIAWVTQHGEIVIPDEHYSATTSQHQWACRQSLRTRDGQRAEIFEHLPE